MSDPQHPRGLGAATSAAIDGPGSTTVTAGSGRVDVEIADADRIGVVVDRLRVTAPPTGDLASRSARIRQELRPGGERLVEVECDPVLGGAVLRSDPGDMRGGRFYQVDLDPSGGADLTRKRVSDDGQRTHEPFTMTRDELIRTVDRLASADGDPDPAA